MFKKFILLSFIVFSLVFSFVYAAEQINTFNTHVFVNKNASIDVTEIINVRAEGNQIRHGLARRLPTNYVDSYGISRSTDYQIQKILLNNMPSPYHVSHESNQLIYIGDKNTQLLPAIILYHFVSRE